MFLRTNTQHAHFTQHTRNISNCTHAHTHKHIHTSTHTHTHAHTHILFPVCLTSTHTRCLCGIVKSTTATRSPDHRDPRNRGRQADQPHRHPAHQSHPVENGERCVGLLAVMAPVFVTTHETSHDERLNDRALLLSKFLAGRPTYTCIHSCTHAHMGTM